MYEGQWKNGKYDGIGIKYFVNGDVYMGHWKNDEAIGYGEYKYVEGACYRGYWLHSFKHYFGIE